MIRKLKTLFKDDFYRHTSIMMAGNGLVNFLNLLYHFILVRLLSGTEYGTLNSLISLTLFFSIFVSPFRHTVTKFLSGYFSHQEFGKVFFVLIHVFKRLGFLSILFLAGFVIAAPFLSSFLQIENTYYLAIIGAVVALSILTPLGHSFLQSAQLFKMLAFVRVICVLGKLLIGAGLVYLGFGVLGGLAGILSFPVLGIGLGLFLIIKYLKSHNIDIRNTQPVKIIPIYKYFLPTGLAMLSFTALTNADIVLVKHFFSPEQAGFYSVAQMVGKIILFLPGAVSMVIFPKAAALHANNLKSLHLLKKGLRIAAISCASATTICIAFPDIVLRVLTSKTYPESIELVGWFALAMSFYALVTIVTFFHLSTHNTRFVLPIFILAIAQVATIYFFHPTLKSVLYILSIFSILAFLTNLFMLRYGYEHTLSKS